MSVEIKPCSGGYVQFGMTGNANTVYLQRYAACISTYQDAKFGKGMRLHTVGKDGKTRCTVCGFGNGIVRP